MKSIRSSLIKACFKSPLAAFALLFGLGVAVAPKAIAQTSTPIQVTTTGFDSPKRINIDNSETQEKVNSKAIIINVIPAPDSEPNNSRFIIPPTVNSTPSNRSYINIPPAVNPAYKNNRYLYIPSVTKPNPNGIIPAEVRAFLDVISWAETGTTEFSSYTKLVFRGSFNDFSTHPKVKNCKVVNGRRLCSNAAGRYQMMGFNWDKLAPKLGLRDFSPESQDKMALYFINKKGAMGDILAGRFEKAVCKLGGTWASFPCNNYRQNPKTMEELKQVYLQRLFMYQDLAGNSNHIPK